MLSLKYELLTALFESLNEDAVSDSKRAELYDLCFTQMFDYIRNNKQKFFNIRLDKETTVRGLDENEYIFKVGPLTYHILNYIPDSAEFFIDTDKKRDVYLAIANKDIVSKDLLTKLLNNEDAIKHELTHLLDLYRFNGIDQDSPQGQAYINDPLEFNALTTETINMIDKYYKKHKNISKEDFINKYIHDITQCRDNIGVVNYFNIFNDRKNFIHNISITRYKRLFNRLYNYILNLYTLSTKTAKLDQNERLK